MNYSSRGFGMGGIPPVTKNILIINIILFVLTIVGQQTQYYDLTSYLALRHPMSEYFMPFQLISYMFMHGGFMHIFFNMWAVVMFGKLLENIWGGKKFFIYYFVTGIGAALFNFGILYVRFWILKSQVSEEMFDQIATQGLQILENDQNYTNQLYAKLNLLMNFQVNIPTVGASGAVFGVLMAFGMLFPNAQLMLMFPPMPIKGKYIAIFALVMGVALDFRGNVAHFAHLGGMVFGYLLIKYWGKNRTMY